LLTKHVRKQTADEAAAIAAAVVPEAAAANAGKQSSLKNLLVTYIFFKKVITD